MGYLATKPLGFDIFICNFNTNSINGVAEGFKTISINFIFNIRNYFHIRSGLSRLGRSLNLVIPRKANLF
jgi:hypothetical protein